MPTLTDRAFDARRRLGKRTLQVLAKTWRRATFRQRFSMDDVADILVVHLKPLGIGDLLMLTPALRALKQRYPEKRVTLATDKDVLARSATIDRIVLLRGAREVRSLPADLLILPQKNLLHTLCLLGRRTATVGCISSWQVSANFPIAPVPTTTPQTHYCDIGMRALHPLGIASGDRSLESLHPHDDELARVRTLVGAEHPSLVVINPFASWSSRTWPRERFAEIIMWLLERGDVFVVISGGPQDVAHNDFFDAACSGQRNYRNLTGQLTLFELAALCRMCTLFVTGDCGPMHVAIAEQAPVLALFAVTDPRTRLPVAHIGKHVHAIYPQDHEEAASYDGENIPQSYRAIRAIGVGAVRDKLAELLDARRRVTP